MFRLPARPALRQPLWTAALLLAATALLLAPQAAMEGAADGLALCGKVIVPSLFPFLFLSALTVELGLAARLGRLLEPVMMPLFRVSGAGAGALVLGLIGGYPVGARTAIRLYEEKLCSREEAQRLLAFCNNSGPAFLFGVVGAGLFGDRRIGLFLYVTHLLACLCVGLLFRFYGPAEYRSSRTSPPSPHTVHFSPAFTHAVASALQSILSISSFVILFSVILSLLTHFGLFSLLATKLAALFAPLGLTEVWAHRLLTGFLEISSGIWSLSGSGSLQGKLVMAAFLLGWGGLSVHCQVLSFAGDCDLSTGTYFAGKILHAVFSACLTALALRFVPLDLAASAPLNQGFDVLGAIRHSVSVTVIANLFLLVCFTILLPRKKEVEKRKKSEYNREKQR